MKQIRKSISAGSLSQKYCEALYQRLLNPLEKEKVKVRIVSNKQELMILTQRRHLRKMEFPMMYHRFTYSFDYTLWCYTSLNTLLRYIKWSPRMICGVKVLCLFRLQRHAGDFYCMNQIRIVKTYGVIYLFSPQSGYV